MPIDWKPLQQIIDEHQTFVISSHVRPDADAIGSALGLASILEELGKSARVINPSATPPHLAFLDPEGRIAKIGQQVSVEEATQADVHVVVDTSAWAQLQDVGKVLKKMAGRKVVIDHHVSSDDLGAVEFKDVSASATGLLITEFAEFLGVALTAPVASLLYCAIATDTGWFRFSNTDGRTMAAAGRLIDAGVAPHLLYRELNERSSLQRLHLHGVVLGRVATECDGRLAHTHVFLKDFTETGAHPTDTEDLVNDCLTVDGVECALILVEQRSGQVKASLRSRGNVSVAAVAEQFGGGGHRQAAGATIDGPLPAAQQRIIQSLTTALRETPPPASS